MPRVLGREIRLGGLEVVVTGKSGTDIRKLLLLCGKSGRVITVVGGGGVPVSTVVFPRPRVCSLLLAVV